MHFLLGVTSYCKKKKKMMMMLMEYASHDPQVHLSILDTFRALAAKRTDALLLLKVTR
jgi:hypothetical protein